MFNGLIIRWSTVVFSRIDAWFKTHRHENEGCWWVPTQFTIGKPTSTCGISEAQATTKGGQGPKAKNVPPFSNLFQVMKSFSNFGIRFQRHIRIPSLCCRGSAEILSLDGQLLHCYDPSRNHRPRSSLGSCCWPLRTSTNWDSFRHGFLGHVIANSPCQANPFGPHLHCDRPSGRE